MAMSAFALDAVSGAPEYTGKMLRGALSALMGPAPASRPLGVTSGVRPGTPSSVVAVSGMTVAVLPHSGILDVQADATTGPYLYAVTASEGKVLSAAHATYARWDRVSVQLSDPAAGDGTSAPGVQVVLTTGTPSASPALPAAPARSLTLAQVIVPQSGGGSPSVVWLAPEWTWTSPRLGTVNQTDLNSVKESGFYSGFSHTNGPVSSTIATILVMRYSADWVIQIFFAVQPDAKGGIWIRSFTSGTTWQAWQKLSL